MTDYSIIENCSEKCSTSVSLNNRRQTFFFTDNVKYPPVFSYTIFENFMWYGCCTFYNFRINNTAFVIGGGIFIENRATISGFRQQGRQSVHSRIADAPSLTNVTGSEYL